MGISGHAMTHNRVLLAKRADLATGLVALVFLSDEGHVPYSDGHILSIWQPWICDRAGVLAVVSDGFLFSVLGDDHDGTILLCTQSLTAKVHGPIIGTEFKTGGE